MYDLVFVTPLPAFYKVNLYNEIAKNKKIYVLFIGQSSEIRTKDFCDFNMNFDYSFFSNENFEKVSLISTFINVNKFIKKIKYKKIVLAGWDSLILWMLAFLSPKDKNYTVIESSIYESKTHGIFLFIKKIYKNRITGVFVSGKPQKLLAEKIGYSNIINTGGVGLFNKIYYKKENKQFKRKFIYVGRLSEEKNLLMLIDVFKDYKDAKLEIIGDGPQKDDILSKINDLSNIIYTPHVENKEIYKKYLDNDIFILPSLKEPWGLVVEEALYFGLPVIVSNNVGSKDDMVVNYSTGKVFDVSSKKSLCESIEFFLYEDNFRKIKQNVDKLDFDNIFKKQVESYNI